MSAPLRTLDDGVTRLAELEARNASIRRGRAVFLTVYTLMSREMTRWATAFETAARGWALVTQDLEALTDDVGSRVSELYARARLKLLISSPSVPAHSSTPSTPGAWWEILAGVRAAIH